MKSLLVLFFFMISVPVVSFGQILIAPEFNESHYAEISRGTDPDNSFNHYVLIYRNTQDTAYRFKKTFRDSSYTELMHTSFIKGNVSEGPFVVYAMGKIMLQGFYKNAKWDGERKTYNNEQLVEKAYFTEGIKTGIWEEYNTQGHVSRRTTYSNVGTIFSDVRY